MAKRPKPPAAKMALTRNGERNPLVPLPPEPESFPIWQDAANVISAQYQQERDARETAGAPSILQQPTLVAHILQGVADGLTPSKACQRIGLSHGQWSDWVQRADREPGSAFASFAEAAKSAIAWREHKLLGQIEQSGASGPQYWTANAWLLERSPAFQRAYALQGQQAGGQVIVNIGVKASEVRIEAGESPADNGSPDDVLDVEPIE